MRRIFKSAIHLFLVSTMVFPLFVLASSVRQLDMEQVVDGSNLVIDATVVGVTAEPTTSGRAIMTRVTFQVNEVVKGEWGDDQINLRFLGGSLAGRQLKIDNMQIPRLGERGIYFVRDPNKVSVHPLKGWSQGHFIVDESSSGEDRIKAANGHYLLELPGGASGNSNTTSVLGGRVASGLKLKSQSDSQVSAQQFKDWIKSR